MPNSTIIVGVYADYWGRVGNFYTAAYADATEDPNTYIRNYSNFSGNVIFTKADNGTTSLVTQYEAAKAEIIALSRNHSDRTSSTWCAHNPANILPTGVAYAGTYYASAQNSGRILSETPFDCPHCALVESRRILAERGALHQGACVICAVPGATIPSRYTRSTGLVEIAGETRPPDTGTLRDYTGAPGYACSNCGLLGHNSRGCERPKRHFDKIGVEVEGRFLRLNEMKVKADSLDATYSGDGSIYESPDSGAAGYEFKTKPGNLRETIEQVIALFPDETDSSCGMHVHMSFPQDCLTLLNTKAFFEFFWKRWEAWGTTMNLAPNGEFFKRLRGDNDYCMPNEDVRVTMHNGERYEQLNFNAWTGHKTLECRLLPMFRRSSLAVAAIQELVAIYEDFLADPEAHGLVMPGEVSAGVDMAYLGPCEPTKLTGFELDSLPVRAHRETHEMELGELAPPAGNMVRIALPVNQPITVEALSTRLLALRAA